MIDNKGRLFGKISLVDLFALAVIAAIVAVIYFGVGGRAHIAAGDVQPILITFFNPALEDFTVDALEIGAPVIDDGNENYLGTVVNLQRGESISIMPDIHGTEVASPMEGYSSVYITARVYGRISDGAVVIGGNVYGVGLEVIIWAGRAKTMLHISSIQVE